MLRRTSADHNVFVAIAIFSTICLAAWAGLPTQASARDWQPAPVALARDYSMIVDTRQPRDIRIVFWVSPPTMPNDQARQVFAGYVVIGVVHAQSTPAGVVSFVPVDTLQASDANGKPLQLLTGNSVPPAVNGALTTMQGTLAASMGQFGRGFHWFVFTAGDVDACKNGGLSVPFAGETYTYQTPIPAAARNGPALTRATAGSPVAEAALTGRSNPPFCRPHRRKAS